MGGLDAILLPFSQLCVSLITPPGLAELGNGAVSVNNAAGNIALATRVDSNWFSQQIVSLKFAPFAARF